MRNVRHLALIEQGLISGGNFLLYLYAARVLPKEAWGELSLALGLILVIQGFQRAFVTIPMVTSGGDGRVFMSSISFWMRVQFFVSAILLVALLISYAMSLWLFEEWLPRTLIYATLLILPIFYLEFARRVTVMSSAMVRLVGMAGVYVCLLGISLLLSAWFGFNSEPWAFVIALATASLGSIVAAGLPVGRLFVAGEDSAWTTASLWNFGRWAAASSLAYTGYNFAVQGVLAAISGPTAVGTLAAARNLTQPVSTLIQAIDTVDKPRAGRAHAATGMPGLWGVIRRSWAWMLLLAVPYLLFVFAFSDEILGVLYASKYRDGTGAVRLWCLVALAMILVQPLETGLYVVRRPDWLFYGRLISALAVLSVTPWLVTQWSFSGALLALFAGWSLAGISAIMQLRKLRSLERTQ